MQPQANPNPKGETMAKKKRKGPTRACEKCGTNYHPRKLACPNCEAANPTYGRKKKVVKKKVSKNGRRKGKRVAASGDSLNAAIKFVESAGGLKAAKAAIEQIERIKNL